MGRKIPGKKHRGVKDPIKQQLERSEKLKSLINAPPSHPDVQELPKSVLEMNRLRELAKSGSLQKKKKKKRKGTESVFLSSSSAGPILAGMNQSDLQFPKLQQRPGESDRSFLNRLRSATDEALSEAKLEARLDVVVNRNKSGEIMEVKPKPMHMLDEPSSAKNAKFKKVKSPLVSGKDKNSVLKEKKLKKKLRKIHVKEDELEKKKDVVKFGEVVHRPPEIKKRPRGCDLSTTERPGKKRLLLTSLLEPGNDTQTSMLHRKHIASAREEAMRIYKEMKKKNRLAQR